MRLPRFTISSLFLVTLVIAVAATGGHYMRLVLQKETSSNRAWLVMFTLASPVVLLVAMSLFHLTKRLLAPNKKRRRVR